MVLFHDNKKEKKERTKGQKRRRVALRVVLILAFLFCVSLWVLGIMGGPHEALREGLEDYISQTTGMETTIGEFDGLYFFPTARFEGGNIILKDDVSHRSVTIDRMEFSSSFWDIFFMRSKLKNLKIENMIIRAGLISTAAIKITEANLKAETSYDQPGLVIDGIYGDEPFSLFYAAGFDGASYFIPDDTAKLFSSLGNYELSGTGGLHKGGGLSIKIDKFGTSDHNLQGSTILSKASGQWTFEFEITNGNSKFIANLTKSKDGVTGSVDSDVVYISDFAGENSMKQVFDQFIDIIQPPSADDKDEDDLKLPQDMSVALDVTLKKIIFRDTDIGHLSFPLKIKDGVLSISDIKGAIMEGKSSGHMILDTQKNLADFDMSLHIDDLKYGADNFEGQAAFDAKLKGAGQTVDGLKSSLEGTITFIGGKGKLDSRALRIWGGGVMNAMLPNFNPESKTVMNCFIADFTVKDGKAEAEPFFMDTNNLTLVGTGTVDIATEKIDFSLKPNTKDISLIDIAFPVNIKGDLVDPSISPDPLGVGTKIGGLFLRSINPAFFALNVAKFGFTDQHPCATYSSDNIKDVLGVNKPKTDKKAIGKKTEKESDGFLDMLPDLNIESAPVPDDQYKLNE